MITKKENTYSIDDAIRELGIETDMRKAADIITLKAEDKFFVGNDGGCSEICDEDPLDHNHNMSICTNSPIL